MSDLFTVTGLELAVGPLLAAGAGHLRHPGTLRAQLDRQQLIARRLRGPVARLVPAAELLVGATGVVAVARASTLDLAAGLALVLYGGYTAFALVLWRRRPGAPCGCTVRDEPVSGWTVVRAAVLASVAGALLATGVASPERTWSTGGAAVVVGPVLGLLLWQLPAAMRSPLPATSTASTETAATLSTPSKEEVRP